MSHQYSDPKLMDAEPSEDCLTIDETEKVIERPPILWNVVFYNDDFTPMDFVTDLIRKYFHYDEQKSTAIMLMIHELGRAVVGTFPHDIAETKAMFCSADAHQHEHPLRVELEAAGE